MSSSILTSSSSASVAGTAKQFLSPVSLLSYSLIRQFLPLASTSAIVAVAGSSSLPSSSTSSSTSSTTLASSSSQASTSSSASALTLASSSSALALTSASLPSSTSSSSSFFPSTLASPLHALASLISELWFPAILWAVPKSKTSHSRKSMRSANKGLKNKTNITLCPGCGSPKLAHNLCPTCYSQITRKWKQEARAAQDAVNEQQEVRM